jgi:hypothetical protein
VGADAHVIQETIVGQRRLVGAVPPADAAPAVAAVVPAGEEPEALVKVLGVREVSHQQSLRRQTSTHTESAGPVPRTVRHRSQWPRSRQPGARWWLPSFRMSMERCPGRTMWRNGGCDGSTEVGGRGCCTKITSRRPGCCCWWLA